MSKTPPDNVRALIPKGVRDALSGGALSLQAAISAEIAELPTLGQVVPGFDADLTAADFATCHAWVLTSIDALPSAAR